VHELGWFCQTYASWLSQLDQDQLCFNVSHPYEFIYPWIEYRVYDIVADTRRLRKKLNKLMTQRHFDNFGLLGYSNGNFSDEHVFVHANILKDFLAAVAELRRTLPKFTLPNDKRSRRRIRDLQGLIDCITEDAKHVLKSILELQQTAIGIMAIEESRRSIKEAISVRRLTQLAFVFIPLSYASSLFGMNIREMTGNGSKLWAFIFTSLVLLISSMCFWWLSSKFPVVWATHMDGRDPGNRGFVDLTKVLYASMQTGNLTWLIREGILLGLVTNNVFGDERDTYQKAYDKFYKDWVYDRIQKKRERSAV
jgi:CorA-like Mg2+ transporter protein